MAPTVDLDPLLTALYDAVLDPALWPDAWAQATAAGGSAPMVVVSDGGTPLPLAASGWNRHTVVTGMGGPPRPAAAEAGALDRSGTIRLNQHLRRAIRLRARLAAAQTVQAASAAALQAADTGVVLLSSGGRLMHADATALRLSGSVGLQLHARSGGVTTPDPAATNYLHTLLHDAAAGGSGGDMLMRGADGSAVAVAVCPLPRPETEAPNGSATPVMLTLRRLVQAPVCPRRLSALFGLTRAEADVAVAIAGGQAVSSVAEGRGVTPGTVQAQVRSALDKTGVPGVQELGLLFARLG